METNGNAPAYELTAEERKHILTEMGKRFTAQDLYEYIEGGDEELIPMEVVLAKTEKVIAEAREKRLRGTQQ